MTTTSSAKEFVSDPIVRELVEIEKQIGYLMRDRARLKRKCIYNYRDIKLQSYGVGTLGSSDWFIPTTPETILLIKERNANSSENMLETIRVKLGALLLKQHELQLKL